jgi:hypothetical protein
MDYTRPATWEDVKAVARELEAAGAEYALVGGYALAAHGFSRFTEDIDLLVNPSADNARRWIVALAHLPDGAAGVLAAEPDVFAADKRYAVRINDEITIDVMPSIAGITWEQMQGHITSVSIDGQSIRLLDLPGLLRTKQGARPKDQMDAAVIRAALQAMNNPTKKP